MNKHTKNLMKRQAAIDLQNAGASPGQGNRARTQRTKKEKESCPKKQRKQKKWMKDE